MFAFTGSQGALPTSHHCKLKFPFGIPSVYTEYKFLSLTQVVRDFTGRMFYSFSSAHPPKVLTFEGPDIHRGL